MFLILLTILVLSILSYISHRTLASHNRIPPFNSISTNPTNVNIINSTKADLSNCPCSNISLCSPVSVQHNKEIFGFSGSDWKHIDFNIVTAIAWDINDPLLICTAHSYNTRLIVGAPDNMPLTNNETIRLQYINSIISFIQQNFIDGITFDYELPINAHSLDREYYTILVAETAKALKSIMPYYQVSVCVAWSPDSIDGRSYDYVGLANGSDLLYVMVYDTRSQIFDQCIASANAPIGLFELAIKRYNDIGIDNSKLVLGVPWYGYVYPCIALNGNFCSIAEVPFRGVNCSDAAGSEYDYGRIMAMLDNVNINVTIISDLLWDNSTQSPFFNMKMDGGIYQVWFDNPESLLLKYNYAKNAGVKGVGPYAFNYLDPTGTRTANPNAIPEAALMWKALSSFLK